MYQVNSQKQLNKIARTAESLEFLHRAEYDEHDGTYLIGPRDDAEKLYWPDTVLIRVESIEEIEESDNSFVKTTGPLTCIKLNNADATYQNLGICDGGYNVMLKIQCCVDHTIDPYNPDGDEEDEEEC